MRWRFNWYRAASKHLKNTEFWMRDALSYAEYDPVGNETSFQNAKEELEKAIRCTRRVSKAKKDY